VELLFEGPLQKVKEAAAKGILTWKGKKVVLDPFSSLGFFYEIVPAEDGFFSLIPHITVGSRTEAAATYELVTPLGALQGGIFRLWEDSDLFEQHPSTLSAKALEVLLKEGLSHRFKGDLPRLKPAPLPILKLTDRTGGFANLHLDYGAWGEVGFHDHSPTPEEKYWENDLLETGFRKKLTQGSYYFCSLDQVGTSIAFLLEMGWKVFDCRGKRVIRQGAITCMAEEAPDAMILRGSAQFGDKELPIQDVVGVFERHERWIDLSPHEVGLIELPAAWGMLEDEERMPGGIRVKKSHIGLLEEIATLPASYQKAEWKSVAPAQAFQGTLFTYQQKGLDWLSFLYRAGFSGLLADEMGLGKTIQVLSFLTSREGAVLIVMPVTLISLWAAQLKQFLPGSSFYIHQGSNRLQDLNGQPIILTSYATLRADINLFTQVTFDAVILDEAQMIKNSSTQMAQSVYQLKAKFRLALTGTPIENRVEEIHSIFRFLIPDLLEGDGLSERCFKKLRPFILRRTKQEVGLDLPDKIIQVVGVDPSDEEYALYETLLRKRRTELMAKIVGDGLPSHRMEVLELILRLRQHCCHPCLLDASYTGEARKFTQVLTDLEEAISSGRKVLVYSQFTAVLQLFRQQFQERGWKYAYLDGSTRDREAAVLQFQNDPHICIFLISLKAGGVGLNLQAADYVFLYDPWWNSAAEEQAIDRAHRIGRKGTVIARKYFTHQTIEAKILDLQSKKKAIAESLWDEQETPDTLSFEDLKMLLF
jgi:superfamily II DNA or RNA helicase